MEQLRIGKKGLYEIEVNDNGETIVIDMEDIDLPFKLNDANTAINNILKQTKAQIKVIEKKEVKQNGLVTNVDEDYRKLYKKAYADMQQAIDGFLGKDACKKIFGGRVYLSMWDDLLTELEPHFEKIGLMSVDTRELVAKKYGNKDEDVLE